MMDQKYNSLLTTYNCKDGSKNTTKIFNLKDPTKGRINWSPTKKIFAHFTFYNPNQIKKSISCLIFKCVNM